MSKCKEYKAALAFAVLAGMTGQAAVAQDTNWYLGGNWGPTKTAIDDDRISDSLFRSGMVATDIEENRSDHGYRVFGGYNLNEHFALELSYFDLGNYGFNAATLPPGALIGELEAKGVALDMVALMPLTDHWSLLGRVGVNHARVEDNFRGTGAVNILMPRATAEETNFKGGLGVQYAFNQRVALRLEAERYRIDDPVGSDGEVDMVSLGLVMKLGSVGSTPVAATQPVQSPTIVLAPVPVAQTEEYCGILDLQFEINNEDIQLADAEKLLVLATFLQKYPETTAVIEGHTDNVGSAADNLTLSQNRADNVVSHLVADHRIAASRLSAIGYGASRPVADNSTELGKQQNRRTGAVIACANDIEGLQPELARITMALLIEFDRDSATVESQYHQSLQRVANFLQANPRVNAVIEGHADNATTGNAQQISGLRAQNVASYLITNFGVARSRLTTEGFGQTRRFAYNTTLEGRQENRRVNIIFEYPQ